jgi:hypothetical protein
MIFLMSKQVLGTVPALRVQCFYAKIMIINVSCCMRCEFLANVQSKLRFCGLWSHSITAYFMTA